MYHFSFFQLYPYAILLLCFIYIINCDIPESKKRLRLFITIWLFTILRYNIGWDYDAYVNTIMSGPGDMSFDRAEPIARLVFYLAYKLNFYPLFFIVFGTVQLWLMNLTIKKVGIETSYSWLLYLLLPFLFLQDLCIVRQALAVQIVLYSFFLLKEKKYIKYILLILVAFNIHKTALIGLIGIPFILFEINNKWNWILFVTSFITSSIISKLLSNFIHYGIINRFMYYSELEGTQSSMIQYLFYAINIFVLINYKKLSILRQENKYLIGLSNIGIVLYNVFSFEPTTAGRICVYYLIFWIFILPQIPTILNINKKKILFYIPFVLIYFYYLAMYINNYNMRIIDKPAYVPFEFWFNHI